MNIHVTPGGDSLPYLLWRGLKGIANKMGPAHFRFTAGRIRLDISVSIDPMPTTVNIPITPQGPQARPVLQIVKQP